MKNRVSFSKSIVKNINVIFALAFLIMFIGGGILLFLTEDNIEVFYIKIASTFVAYVALYLAAIIYLGNNIRKQFAPLDKLAQGLRDNSIDIIGENDDIKSFALSLKADIDKLDNLNNELKETKDNLDYAYVSNEKAITSTLENIDECKSILLKSSKRQKKVKDSLLQLSSCVEDIMNEVNVVKHIKRELTENSENIYINIQSTINNQDEIKHDYARVCESYETLNNTLNESVELIDSLFSEISVLQNIASQISLYAMNSSIEASRSGIFNINITNALDELKDLSGKIQSKSDDIALLSIRSKNSLNLAIEQSEFCNEENGNNLTNIKGSVDRLLTLSNTISETIKSTDSIADSVNTINMKIQEIDDINSGTIKDSDYVLDSAEGLGKQLFKIDKSLKTDVQ